MKIYLLPGLGADHRLFSKLTALGGHEVVPLNWIPRGNAKTLAEYAAKLQSHYSLESPFALGGVSLGGMLALEWAQLCKPEFLVLVSTIISREEMPLLMRFASKMDSNLFKAERLQKLASLGDRFTIKSPEGRRLFRAMLKECDMDFLEWGAHAILHWRAPSLPDCTMVRLHGTRDAVFPIRNIKNAISVRGGNHFMIFDKSEEIAHVIGRCKL